MKYKNLILIGTSHIARQSLDEVRDNITTQKPEIVAIELDKKRFEALLSEKKHKPSFRDIKKVGVKGYLFSLLGAWAEKKLGQEVGVMPGAEMKKAIELARQYNLSIALIDDDIENILKRISSSLTWREKFNFLVDIFKAIFKREKIVFDLSKVPEEKIIRKLIGQVKKRYPNLYRVLIIERNRTMANRLIYLMEKNTEKNILAIVGAGHVDGILKLIKST